MKKLILALALTSALFACKKETTNPTTSNKNNPTSSVVCLDNPSINFTAIGTPVGKFSDCIKDIDGNVYKTVTIGSQTWMAENLKTSKYNDGTPIPNVIDNNLWNNDTSGAWAYYNNDVTNNAKYGKLYDWYAVSKTTNGNKNVCPTGWHIPTDEEWTVLTDYLGGEGIIGGKMKEVSITSWNSPNKDATNTSLFTGLPGGYREDEGFYYDISEEGYWWSSTEYDSNNARLRILNYYKGYIESYKDFKKYGLSVRCLRD
jgi:uncharacterized protein (TIGR02145 family)